MQKILSSELVKHLFIFAVFMVIPYLFNSHGGLFEIPSLYNGHDRTYLFIYFLVYVFLYINYYLLLPQLYLKEKYFAYFSVVSAVFLLFVAFSLWFDRPLEHLFDKGGPMQPPFNVPPNFGEKPNQIGHTLLIFLIGVISSLLFSIQNRLQVVKEQSTQAQLQMLRAQINPHFLFNTLNSLYALALKKDDRTPQAIINLSEFMRYAITNQQESYIELAAEIKYLESFIELQKARLGNTVNVCFSVNGMAATQRIAPLIFITFLENAFKHGISSTEKAQIDIQINMTPTFVTLEVENPIYKNNSDGTGIGLSNTLKRLELMYPNKHQLETSETNGRYRVFLKLEL